MKVHKILKDGTNYYPLFFTVIFLVILFQYSFSALEATFYDLRVRLDIGTSHSRNIVFITMDEESEEFLGESYPYTYIGHKRLIERMVAENPAAIAYLVDFNEPQTNREMEHFLSFKELAEKYIRSGGIFRLGTSMNEWGERLPPESLRDLGYSLALINLDNMIFSRDDLVRRTILNVSGEDTFHLWLANRYRARNEQKPLRLNEIKGAYYLRDADATFSLFRYPFAPLEENMNIDTIPFHRAQVGNFSTGYFTDKIIIIGPSYISKVQDFALTPFSPENYHSSKLLIHGAIIDSLVQNKTIGPIPRKVSFFLSCLIALLLSFAISSFHPTRSLVITAMMMMSVLLLSYVLFVWFGLWLYTAHLILTIFVVFYIWVPFRAIGEYQRRYAIQEETKLLKKVENLKQNFISLMSHDLKTPVAKIAGLADVMKQKYRDNASVSKDLDMVELATKELNGFINSILDLTKIESQDLTLNKVSKDVNKLIESSIDSLKFEADKKDIRILTELSPLYPIKIDVTLIQRVFSNLIENAIKYSTPNKNVVIKTWDDEKWVYIEVSDDGIGIPEDELEYIFDRFYRVKSDMSHSVKGTGLGLYLVKYFVELHGGEIAASSELGQGTKFTVKLKNE